MGNILFNMLYFCSLTLPPPKREVGVVGVQGVLTQLCSNHHPHKMPLERSVKCKRWELWIDRE